MPSPAGPTADPDLPDRQRRLRAPRINEQLKLTAAAFDRAATVVLAGAVFAPAFQHKPQSLWETGGWLSWLSARNGALRASSADRGDMTCRLRSIQAGGYR
jgi:hypothetical protein